ncbi:MAG: hypothetical protein K9M51_03600 [Candidatus Gracilibacteria bacterium]|nr:hypothetical protein [Candidatus Gracilibacteria bacterium]
MPKLPVPSTMRAMQTLVKICFALLGLLLPWHGAITVFLPEPFRWWKEAVLLVLLGIVLWNEVGKIRAKSWEKFSRAQRWAIGFLVWCLTLVILSEDQATAAIAARYLGMGFVTFLIVSRTQPVSKNALKIFANFFFLGLATSIIFGLWVKWGGGAEIVQNFYSNTISSWVPGQTIPLWHETGGFIRMQGASSGPTVFSHLLVAGLALLLWRGPTLNVWLKMGLGILFLAGIAQSFSRAALGGAFLLVFFSFLPSLKLSAKKAIPFLLLLFLVGGGFLFLNKNIVQNFLSRDGTSAHFSRPVEAVEMGLRSPLWGNLGELGPAARARNLEENNDDRAPIAENVPADWLAQLGIPGFFLGIGFLVTIFLGATPLGKGFVVVSFLLMNFATIFDMMPVAITFFMLFAFWQKSETISGKGSRSMFSICCRSSCTRACRLWSR